MFFSTTIAEELGSTKLMEGIHLLRWKREEKGDMGLRAGRLGSLLLFMVLIAWCLPVSGKHDEDMKMSIMLGKRSLIMNINDYDDPTANQRHSPFKSKPKMPQKGRKRKG
ncbi:uncharacterized protein LOC111469456 [Cucurbita maxima]|uniref:Uncharacterized protein LOC111469456 n=1 Tax=Cucurbita maxima TaxID=3661 RepID=A0A6J1I305_CUCMA|nr:uncharacterized protein LOC111469456 [Cucurbita maxima]